MRFAHTLHENYRHLLSSSDQGDTNLFDSIPLYLESDYKFLNNKNIFPADSSKVEQDLLQKIGYDLAKELGEGWYEDNEQELGR